MERAEGEGRFGWEIVRTRRDAIWSMASVLVVVSAEAVERTRRHTSDWSEILCQK
jgi:hypothetical protein